MVQEDMNGRDNENVMPQLEDERMDEDHESDNDIMADMQNPPPIANPAANPPADEITAFFVSIGLSQHAQCFITRGFMECDDIEECTDEELLSYGICLEGHRKRILRKLRARNAAGNNDGAQNVVAGPNGNVNAVNVGGNVEGIINIGGGNVEGNGNVVGPAITEPSEALELDFEGTAYGASLMKGGETAGQCRQKIWGVLKARRFDIITFKRDGAGRYINYGHRITRRTLEGLAQVALVRLTDIYDPRSAARRGRGGSQYWGCKVWRQGPGVAHDSLDRDGQQNLRRFMRKYKDYIPWNNYALACGDLARCCELELFNFDVDDEEQNENKDEKQPEH